VGHDGQEGDAFGVRGFLQGGCEGLVGFGEERDRLAGAARATCSADPVDVLTGLRNAVVPPGLDQWGTTVKKATHSAYGAFYKEGVTGTLQSSAK
jgi:hypothetical protein